MKILVSDRDKLSSQMITSKLTAAGFTVVEEPDKNRMVECVKSEGIDVVYFDTAPLSEAQPIVLGIRRSAPRYPFVVLLTQDITRADAFRMGCNDILHKPVTGTEAGEKAHNAARLIDLVRLMGDDREDFPSAGGIISKSAFNQLFRSAIDRAGRYGELSYIVSISVENYNDIQFNSGDYAADFAVSKMAQHLVYIRRQSDIIGQTGKSHYMLLLQRPMTETEPAEAAARFATTLSEVEDIASSVSGHVDICVRLIHLPTGALEAEHHMTKEGIGGAG